MMDDIAGMRVKLEYLEKRLEAVIRGDVFVKPSVMMGVIKPRRNVLVYCGACGWQLSTCNPQYLFDQIYAHKLGCNPFFTIVPE